LSPANARWRPGDPVNWERPGELWTAGGLHAFVLESVGARTGQLRRAVLGYLEDGPDAWLIIGSKGGAPSHPAWVHNLAADSDATVVLADGQRVPVSAERLRNDDLERAWQRIDVEAPEYATYRSRVSRPIPVIRLRRRQAPTAA
jgi:deazaflavin-dependent oxidoreductase (nitroreductase family)